MRIIHSSGSRKLFISKKRQMENKRILCLIDGLGSGGAQRQLVTLSALLTESNYDVRFLWYHKSNFYEKFLRNHNVKYLQILPKNKFTKLIYVCYHILRQKPSVIIAYLDSPCIIACIVKILCPWIRLIVSERNTTQILNRTERIKFFLYRFADAIVPNSYSQTNYIKEHYSNLDNKVFTITNYTDTEAFARLKEYNTSSRIQMVCVGRINEQKNILRFLSAIKKAIDKGAEIRVKWYGFIDKSNQYWDKCTSLANELKLNEIVEFCGPNDDIITAYNKANVFCLPSIYEGFPNVVCEAMSCGLPILCSDVCDNPYLVKDGINGLLFDPFDEDSIANTIYKFYCIGEERKLMAQNSRSMAVEHFSKDDFVNKYIKVINGTN